MAAVSRRWFLEVGAGAGSAALLPAWLLESRNAYARDLAAPTHPVVPGSYVFFSAAEITFIDAAVGRLIPRDLLGPGAAEAGVTLFLDRQLAGGYGHAVNWYMTGPWAKGSDEQGYQLERTPAQLYRAAIEALDAYCRKTYRQKVYASLSTGDQDALLHELEKGKLELPGVDGKAFFDMLWKNTQEGYFADPMYEGNRGFAGWKLVGYPGPRYNYDNEIRHYGQPYPLPTVGLLGRDPSRRIAS